MRVVVIGAGMAGLTAARTLHDLSDSEIDVTVLERSRGVGGRMATRRIGDATFDHGAQFFTVRTPAFGSRVDDWTARGLVRVWNHGFDGDDGFPRYVASTGMTSLAKDLADGLRVECSTMAFALRRPASDGSSWNVVLDDGTVRPADRVILTTPLPQSFGLLADAGLDLEVDLDVFRVDYDRTIALLAVLDRPVTIAASGGIQPSSGVFAFIGDQMSKGVSSVPAVTFHAGAEWSEAHWDDGVDALGEALAAAARPWLGDAAIIAQQVKKWRFATPRTISPDPCVVLASSGGRRSAGSRSVDGSIVLAGDAFAGPRVEGAHNSGLAAANALLR